MTDGPEPEETPDPGDEHADGWDGLAHGEPALRAGVLALGLGVIWVALSHWRRRAPGDLW